MNNLILYIIISNIIIGGILRFIIKKLSIYYIACMVSGIINGIIAYHTFM